MVLTMIADLIHLPHFNFLYSQWFIWPTILLALLATLWCPMTFSALFWTILWTPVALLDRRKLYYRWSMVKCAQWLSKHQFYQLGPQLQLYHTHHPFFHRLEFMWLKPGVIALLVPTGYLGPNWDRALSQLLRSINLHAAQSPWRWSCLLRINGLMWIFDLFFWWFFSLQVNTAYRLFSHRSSFGKYARDFSFFSLFLFYVPVFYTRAYLKEWWIPWMYQRLVGDDAKDFAAFFDPAVEVKERNPEKIFYNLFNQFKPT